MKVVVHSGVVFAYDIHGGWYRCILAFPGARGDVNDSSVLKYVKENTIA